MDDNSEKIPWFTMISDEKITCKVLDVYDGDTVTLCFPFNGKFYKDRCRLYGINCPEIRTRDKIEKQNGYTSRNWLISRVLNKTVYVQFYGKDKYGRLLVSIYETLEDEFSVNNRMITQKLATVYE